MRFNGAQKPEAGWQPTLHGNPLAAWGVTAFGKALGLRQAPSYTQAMDECLSCRAPGAKDCAEHIFGSCCAAQPVRD